MAGEFMPDQASEECPINGVSGPITLTGREGCRDDQNIGRHDEEEDRAGR